jgi:hypothetical protein
MANEVTFFKTRREVEIGDFHSLKSKGNERRVKATIRIPLSNRPTTGIPDWVLDGYQFVVKDASHYTKTNCKDMSLEGMSLDIFTTDTVKRKMLALNACKLDRFSIERVGEEEKAVVYLNVTIYAPTDEEQIVWWFRYQGYNVFVEFDTTQASFAYDGEDADPEAEDAEDVPGDMAFVIDPNDDPDAPIPGDTRSATLPSDPPRKRSHHTSKKK